jgi:hemolysin activation/secretion protein
MGQAPTLRWPQLGGYDTVRGFSASRALGRELIVGNFELRHRLIGLRLPLADLATLQATVFMDAGAVRSHLGGSGLGLLSGGLGLRLNFVKFARALIRMEFAQTIQPSEGWDLTFGLGSFF